MKYPIYIEKDKSSDYGVTIPDLPGCFSGGSTLEEALENAEEAVLTHIEGLLLDHENIPEPTRIEEHKQIICSADITWAIISVDLSKLSGKSKRINITIPERILSKIDLFASREGESRSGLIAAATMEYIHHHQ